MPKNMMMAFAKDVKRPAPPGFTKHLAGEKPMDDGPMPIMPPPGADMEGKQAGDKVQIVIEGTVTEDGMVKPDTWNGVPWDAKDKPDMDKGSSDDQGGMDDEPEPEAA